MRTKLKLLFFPVHCGALLFVALTLCASQGFAQFPGSFVPVLVSGQSNADGLVRHLPQGTYVAVARGGTSIRYWDWDWRHGDLGTQLVRAVDSYQFGAFVWWQGETDGLDNMSAAEYQQRLIRILMRVNRPTMIIEMSDHPSRMHIKQVQANIAQHHAVALIDTSDLPQLNPHDFTGDAYANVALRVQLCYFQQCWLTQ